MNLCLNNTFVKRRSCSAFHRIILISVVKPAQLYMYAQAQLTNSLLYSEMSSRYAPCSKYKRVSLTCALKRSE